MSASLVGSEMCIRDSNAERGSGAGPARPGGQRVTAEHQGTPHGRHGGTVSYTHLTLPTICSV
eukprot:485974-Alexandrium_andersonii.AAC.1